MGSRIPFAARKGSDVAGELESLLAALVNEHETWRQLLSAHREAIRRADGGGVQNAVARQATVLQSIADLEERRRRLVDKAIATEGILGAGKSADDANNTPKRSTTGPVTLSQIAESLPEPSRARLLELAGRLRFLLTDIESQNRTLRTASSSLVAHMEGLMRQVARRLSHAGTYGRKGYVDTIPVVTTALDFTR